MISSFVKTGLVAVAALLFTAFTVAIQEIQIQTTAVCGMCKDRIEGTLNSLEGVEKATLDLESKLVTIAYDDTKQSPASLRSVISRIGYAADGVGADATAWEGLPGCCKAGSNAKGASAAKTCTAAEKAAGKACCKKDAAKEGSAEAGAKKACCKKDGEKKSCSKDGNAEAGAKKACCKKDGAKTASAEAGAKKACCKKDGAEKSCANSKKS